MKISFLTTLFIGLVSFAFSQVTNTPISSPTANNQAMPYLQNNTIQNGQNILAQPYAKTGFSNPQSNLGGDHRCKTYELNQQHYLDRGIQNEFNAGYQQHAYQVTTYGVPKTSGTNEISVIFSVSFIKSSYFI